MFFHMLNFETIIFSIDSSILTIKNVIKSKSNVELNVESNVELLNFNARETITSSMNM